MIRNARKGPTLPKSLLEKIENGHAGSKYVKNTSTRKAQRKEARQEKKRLRKPQPRSAVVGRKQDVEVSNYNKEDRHVSSDGDDAPQPIRSDLKPPKSILKKPKPAKPPHSESEDGSDSTPALSRAVKAGIADDDAEIAALEKKLGIKGKKSKALEDDGLEWLVDGSDRDEGDNLKRKRPEDTKWFRDKRLKASVTDTEADESDEDENLPLEDDNDNDDEESENFEGFDSDAGDLSDEPIKTTSKPSRKKENPYVPPMIHDTIPATYVPPHMRKTASEEETLERIRGRVKGLLNRLSAPNMLSILKELETIYETHARQHITSTLVESLVSLIADPAILNDTFLISHAGFAASVYKVRGTDFGAQLLEKMVQDIDRFLASGESTGKQPLNLLGFLSCLYNFQLVGSPVIFDYIRLLLEEVSENNTELLLRIIRTSGQQLRQDDPLALKDVVLLLQRAIASVGEAQLSVRTKFMVDTIQDLKNNRLRAGLTGSAVTKEHTNNMKKTLARLKETLPVKVTEPLRVSLADIHDADKNGKWWLVGASYRDPAKTATAPPEQKPSLHDDAGYESDTPNINFHKLAKEQGMNTDVRRAIFIAIVSSVDYIHAHMQIVKLHLKKKQMLEIPGVLVHCVGMEEAYNPFYALIAGKFCNEHRLRKAFQFTLWNVLKRLDPAEDGEVSDQEKWSVRKMGSIAKFYGSLIASRRLSLAILRKLDSQFAYAPDASVFVEVLLTYIFLELRRTWKKKEGLFEQNVKDVFSSFAAPSIVPGLRYMLETHVIQGKLARTEKEKKAVASGCEIAVEALQHAAHSMLLDEDSEDGE
jgi:nucleolar MIF4G domain-containing protein 1